MKPSLSERDLAVLWHPFTQMKTAAPPIAVAKGKGAKLWDEDGKVYIDAVASWWMNLHGHAHPAIAEALAKQALELEHVIFADFTHRPAVELAERVLGKLPANQARVFYSDNGSTTVEVALKMAFQYWHNIDQPRRKVIAFEGAYHGDTFGAMSVGGRSAFSEPFAPFLFDVIFVEPPLPGQEKACIANFQALLEDNKGTIAAFIFEPLVQGAAGMRMYSPDALEAMLQLCKAHEVLAIADEVMTGFGRTGRFWATDYIETKPDIYCLSKGLTGGTMALGITTCTAQIFDAFWSDDKMKTLFHGHSCTGNPLACSVGLASMDLMDMASTWVDIDHIVARHTDFQKRLSRYPNVTNLRQQGVILAFELADTEETSYFNNLRDRIWHFFIERGLLLRPLGNTIYILPPYCITDEELDLVYNGIEELLKAFA